MPKTTALDVPRKTKLIRKNKTFFIQVPAGIIRALNVQASQKDVYCTLTNRVLQISSGEPISSIPVLTLDDFIIPSNT